MNAKPIQIYLTEEQYNVLREAAAQYEQPMTAVVRDLIQKHLVEGTPPPTDISDLVGTLHSGHQTDIANDEDRMIAEAFQKEFDRKRARDLR